MLDSGITERHLVDGCRASGEAPRIAAAAALLEMGERLGLVDLIAGGAEFTVADLAKCADLPEAGVSTYCEALESAAIIESAGTSTDSYRPVADFDHIRNQAGYVSWTMNANRPFIENAREFLEDLSRPSGVGLRDGKAVAISSHWMGSQSFYPAALAAILDTRPEVTVDLGAGTCRLLIDVLLQVPGSRAVGLDLDPDACREAAKSAERAGVESRLEILERSIQSIATDASPLDGAQVIHGGFVFHDMMPEEENVADAVLANCRTALRPGGLMAITEAVPYLRNDRERRFSAIVTYYHTQFMKRKLLREDEWLDKLRHVGFSDVRAVELAFPTGRLFLAQK